MLHGHWRRTFEVGVFGRHRRRYLQCDPDAYQEKGSEIGPYVHVAGNLYTVLTPLKAGATKSTIEDCFADEIKNLNLGGKTFNANSKIDTAAHFGKHKLSEYIRENSAKVDFTGFAGLLDRINDAIEGHQAKVAGAAAASGVAAQP
jgi:hypothetical protein